MARDRDGGQVLRRSALHRGLPRVLLCGRHRSVTDDGPYKLLRVIEKGGELYVFSQFFLPAEKIQEATERDGIPYQAYVQRGILKLSGENFVDYDDCFQWFKALIEKHEVYPLQVGYDKWMAQNLVKDMEQYGFHMDDVYQGFNLTPVLREMEGLMKDGKVHIGDNDLLKIHLLDAALKMDTETSKVKLIKMSPTAHIDGTAALSRCFLRPAEMV